MLHLAALLLSVHRLVQVVSLADTSLNCCKQPAAAQCVSTAINVEHCCSDLPGTVMQLCHMSSIYNMCNDLPAVTVKGSRIFQLITLVGLEKFDHEIPISHLP